MTENNNLNPGPGFRRSAAPSPIDTTGDDGVQWIPFDVRDFEDRNAPLMFLDSYTQKSNGWPMIRAKARIPEEYITRLPFKSACLQHGYPDVSDAPDAPASTTETTTQSASVADTTAQSTAVADAKTKQLAEIVDIIFQAHNDHRDLVAQLLAFQLAQPDATPIIKQKASAHSMRLHDDLEIRAQEANLTSLGDVVVHVSSGSGSIANKLCSRGKTRVISAMGRDNHEAQDVITTTLQAELDRGYAEDNGALLDMVKTQFHADNASPDTSGTESSTGSIDGGSHELFADDSDKTDWEKDPSYQYFVYRLDQQKHLRHHRFHPISKYTSEDEDKCEQCQKMRLPDGVQKPQKIIARDQDWKALKDRYDVSLHKLDAEDNWDDRRCPICHESFSKILKEDTTTSHWYTHRYNYTKGVLEKQHCAEVEGEPLCPTVANSPLFEFERLKTSSKLRDQYRYLEKLCNLAENEVLEREEFCRVCFQTFDYGTGQLTKHYELHEHEEHVQKHICEKWSELDEMIAADNEQTSAGSVQQDQVSSSTSDEPLFSPTTIAAAKDLLETTIPIPNWTGLPAGLPFIASNMPPRVFTCLEQIRQVISKKASGPAKDFAFTQTPQTAKQAKKDVKHRRTQLKATAEYPVIVGSPSDDGFTSQQQQQQQQLKKPEGKKRKAVGDGDVGKKIKKVKKIKKAKKAKKNNKK